MYVNVFDDANEGYKIAQINFEYKAKLNISNNKQSKEGTKIIIVNIV